MLTVPTPFTLRPNSLRFKMLVLAHSLSANVLTPFEQRLDQ